MSIDEKPHSFMVGKKRPDACTWCGRPRDARHMRDFGYWDDRKKARVEIKKGDLIHAGPR